MCQAPAGLKGSGMKYLLQSKDSQKEIIRKANGFGPWVIIKSTWPTDYVPAKSLQSCLTLRPHGLQPAGLLCPWDFPGSNTGVGCHFLLQEIFLTQGSNPHFLCLLHWRAGSLRITNKTQFVLCSRQINLENSSPDQISTNRFHISPASVQWFLNPLRM